MSLSGYFASVKRVVCSSGLLYCEGWEFHVLLSFLFSVLESCGSRWSAQELALLIRFGWSKKRFGWSRKWERAAKQEYPQSTFAILPQEEVVKTGLNIMPSMASIFKTMISLTPSRFI